MQNLHRHSSFSNAIVRADSAASNEDYAKRAVELGHRVLSSLEHGYQGNYYQTYELAKKYNLKTVIGAEAYWVKNRFEKDKSNHHICIWAKSNQGREALNDILSEANITGYYYRPRIDIPLILSLPPNDVVVSSACLAFSGYEDIDIIVEQFHDHFGENFFLEQQYHNTEKQKEWSKHQLKLADRFGINFLVGLDSHYIYPEEALLRDYILEAKEIHYEDEEGWYMDYPEDEEIIKRFNEQNIFSEEQVKIAMNNTDVALDFCDYDTVRVFTKDIKLPSLYPELTKEEKDKKYSQLISKKFKEYTKNISANDYQRYFDGVKAEIQTYKDTGMCDYPLLDYAIVKEAVEHGGLITDTGRGSAVSFFTNTLCGFSKIDRFTSAIKLYPERFISTTRILETKSLPDIDLNVGTPEIFEKAQEKVLGKNHAVAMLSYGTLKKKSAFKLYAKAKNMDFKLANKISEQIGQYEEELRNVSEEDKEFVDIYDFVDKEYKEYIEQSKNYWGVISDKKKAPSAYLLYDGDIRKEIGLIKCKSEDTGKEYLTCVIDGSVAENYKFLKNDILKVDVVLLIDKVFKRIGIKHFDVNTLIEKTKNDKATWDIYAYGYTMGINQVEKEGSTKKCMKYKPKNISELSAVVAAIRPGFKSMYDKFEARENFSYGIPALDNMLRTEELPVSFIFFQEQCMMVLNYAGFPMSECYGAIKAIAKKHPEKVRPLKEKFIDGFQKKLIEDEKLSESKAKKNAESVWNIINDNCGYSFNSSHAYSVALDSLYQAWQKAHYPYEFYETLLQHYVDKGNKNKVMALKKEMKTAFGIKEGKYKFDNDNRQFTADINNHCIYPNLSAIKKIGSNTASVLYELAHSKKYSDFIELLEDIKLNKSINNTTLNILIHLDYFSKFGHPNQLLKEVEIFEFVYGKKEFLKDSIKKAGYFIEDFTSHSIKETDKKIYFDDTSELLDYLIKEYPGEKTTKYDYINYEYEYLGYIQKVFPKINEEYYYVTDVKGKTSKMVSLYQISTGQNVTYKIRKKLFESNPFEIKNCIHLIELTNDFKWKKEVDEKGKEKWIQTSEREILITKYSVLN